jgi:bidirectional [NiFe] hydrogenase diaphorase subunit
MATSTTTTAKVVTFKIDDRDMSGRDDESVLEIAQENGIYIPTLCHLEGLSEIGACRLCLVEIKGSSRLLPACTTLVSEGMEIYTQSERLQQYRRMVIEMLFAEGNHVCSVCVSNGHCELQTMAGSIGLMVVELPYRYPKRSVDASHARFGLDHNRCILCTRCIRVCDEVEGAHNWDMMGRGINSHIIADLNQPWGDSITCTTCGKCVQICPTGALFEKGQSVGEMTKRNDFLANLIANRERRK